VGQGRTSGAFIGHLESTLEEREGAKLFINIYKEHPLWLGVEDVTTSSSSMDANPRRIIRSMSKGKAMSSLSLFCITLV